MAMNQVRVTIDLPRAFVPLTGISEEALPAELRKLLATELVRRGELTVAKAAELLEVSQAEFITYLSDHGVSIFHFAPDELRDEIGA